MGRLRDPLWGLGASTLALIGCTSSMYLYHHLRSLWKLPLEAFLSKGVLITGCDTGIGLATAKYLSEEIPELRIFASCLTSTGCDDLDNWATLSGRDNLTTFVMDVTNEASVLAGVETVSAGVGSGDNLLAVINNAGVYDGFYVELTPVESFKKVLEVGFIGTVRVSKAFLPMLVRGRGRLLNVTSVAAVFTTPANAAYTAAKHALRAFSDTLRMEVRSQGVQVIQVIPSAVRTPSLEAIPKSYVRLATNANAEVLARYGGSKHAKYFAALMQEYLSSACEPEIIAGVICRALTSAHPKALYYAGPGSRLPIPFSLLPMFVVDIMFADPVKKVDRMILEEEAA